LRAPVASDNRKQENEHTNATHGEDPIDPAATITSTPRPDAAAAVVMGVSGSGKSTVEAALAGRLGWEFVDGDSLHPHANVAKMQAGNRLTTATVNPGSPPSPGRSIPGSGTGRRGSSPARR